MLLSALSALTVLALLPTPAHAGEDDEEIEFSADIVSGSVGFARMAARASAYSATPGGAQDIGHFRQQVDLGGVPHPNTFTPEGLLSEHDLPLDVGHCDRLICPGGQAVEARLLAQEEVRWIGQLGFGSNLNPATFERSPLNLVAVVDHSGSMGGPPLETVKASLIELAQRHLNKDDQLSIVIYGTGVATALPPTRGDQTSTIVQAVKNIHSDGGTYMELGLETGFDLARQTRRTFDGTTRVMLFTDERPNIGRTEAGSFMDLARKASKDHIGMTTVGVGVQFGAELATKISSVRGGNLFFFPGVNDMKTRFEEDFDTMVTELAYDMELEVTPAPGLKVAGVYGIPGDAMTWTDNGGIRMTVETMFLSKDGGAIYFGFAPKDDNLPVPSVGSQVATIHLDYQARDGNHEPQAVPLTTVSTSSASTGLQRGLVLVDQVTSMKKATRLHHEANDQEAAWQIIHDLAGRMKSVNDRELDAELRLVTKLEETLATMAGRANEPKQPVAHRDPVSGVPVMR